MQHISEHFTFHELVRTSHKELVLLNALRGMQYLPDCFYLCEFLEHLRSFLDRPLKINSGFRCKALNNKVNGALSSDHLCFCAVDIPVSSDEVLSLGKYLSRHDSVRMHKYYNSGYIHISLRRLTDGERRMYSTYYDDSFELLLYSEIASYY